MYDLPKLYMVEFDKISDPKALSYFLYMSIIPGYRIRHNNFVPEVLRKLTEEGAYYNRSCLIVIRDPVVKNRLSIIVTGFTYPFLQFCLYCEKNRNMHKKIWI